MKTAIFLVLLFPLAMVNAEVYRWVAPDGSVTYSDEPVPGAVVVPMPVFPPPPPPRHYPAPPPARHQPALNGKYSVGVYKQLSISAPHNDENVRDNEGNVTVKIIVKPELDKTQEHRIQLMLDGAEQGESSESLEQVLRGVRRGRHAVTAKVIDKGGRVLISSRPVYFFMVRQSPLFHPPRPDAPHSGVQQSPRAPMAPRAPRAPHVPFKPSVQPSPTPTPTPPPPPN